MYKMLLVSDDSGFSVLSQKFIPYLDPSAKVITRGSVDSAMSCMETDSIDAVVFDHTAGNDISDMIRAMDRSGKMIPIVLVSKSATKDVLAMAVNESIAGYVDRSVGEPMDYFKEICHRTIIAVERGRLGADRNVNERRLEAMVHMAKMNDRDLSEVINYALETAVDLTKSEAGFVASYDKDRRILRMLAWSKGAMKRCDITNYPVEFPLDTTGVWGEPVRTGKSIVINNYEGDRRLLKKGVPEGHMHLSRLLLVPLFAKDGGIIGTAGVANKADEYTASDEMQLNLLMGEMFLTFAKREELKRTTAPAQVLRELTDVGTTGVAFVTIDLELAFLNRIGMAILGVSSSDRLPVAAENVDTAQMQTIIDLVNHLRAHGGPSLKGSVTARIGERNRSYSVTVYSTAGLGDMHPGFTVFMEDVTDLKRMDETASRVKEHVAILEGPVLDSLAHSRRFLEHAYAQAPDDDRNGIARTCETIAFMSDYRNVGLMPAIWIDLEDAIRTAKNRSLTADMKANVRTNGIKVLADPAFPAVFAHLFRNTVDHGQFANEIDIRCNIKDGGLTIVYEDNGAGIDPDVRGRVFNMVYDGKFGMFLVYNIVSMSGFSIRCPDSPGGAVFEITVPPAKYSLG